jgi:hypothetical protein
MSYDRLLDEHSEAAETLDKLTADALKLLDADPPWTVQELEDALTVAVSRAVAEADRQHAPAADQAPAADEAPAAEEPEHTVEN